jgi:MFS family permease
VSAARAAGPADAAARVARVVISVQALRAFAYGFSAVILGTSLPAQGLSDVEVGAVFTTMLGGMALASFAVGRWGDRLGRRRLYRLLLAVMGGAGAVFALTSWLPALVIAALTGTLSTDANESGPITTLEQSMLADAPAELRSRVYGRYNAAAYLAGSVGSLVAGGPAAIRRVIHGLPADQHWLLAFPVLAIAGVAVAAQLARIGTDQVVDRFAVGSALGPSRATVRRLAMLFAVDAAAGGLVVQSFLVFWFHRRFGASTEVMGAVLFGTGLLSAGSSLVAGWLGPRLGLLETMVFTHIPSNVLLLLVALMPNLGAAVAVLLARFALSQMDVPARQAMLAVLVQPEERTAAAGYTNTARYVGRPAGPALAGLLMQRVWIAAPFLVAGGLKIAYDLVVFAAFRAVPAVRRART